MIADLLDLAIRLNLAASAAIVLVLILRGPVRALAGARLSYALWLAVPIVALAALAPRGMAPALPALELPAVAQGVLEIWDHPVQALAGAPADIAGPALDGQNLAAGLWLLGALMALAYFAIAHLRFVRRLGSQHRRVDGTYLTASSAGPAVIGTLRPRIIIPSDFERRFEPREQAAVLAHESAHVRRGDPLANALVVLTQCLNWFNPLVHLAAHHIRVDQELACDADVIARFPTSRRAYAEAMLKTQLADAYLPLGCYWPAGSEEPLRQRLNMLKRKPPGAVRSLFGSGLIACIALGAGYAAWTAAPAMAQAPVIVQGAVGAALAAPPQAKVAAPPSAPTVKAGAGGLPAASPSAATPAPPPFTPEIQALIDRGLATPEGRYDPYAVKAADYDHSKQVQVRGTITSVQWSNPSTIINMTDDQGRAWTVVNATPNTMLRNGLDRAMLAAGAELTLNGYPHREGACAPECRGEGIDLTLANGTKFSLLPPPPAQAAPPQ